MKHCVCLLAVLLMASASGWTLDAQSSDDESKKVVQADKVAQLIDSSTDQSINNGLSWLAAQQNEDGSLGTDRLLAGNTAVCGLAGLAFLSQGSTTTRGRYAENIRRCVGYLQTHFQPESGLFDNPNYQSSGPMYGHGFATLFAAEVYGMSGTESLKPQLEKAVQLIVSTQHESGGWRYQPNGQEADISVTVCQLMALRAARNAGFFVPTATVDKAVQYIRFCLLYTSPSPRDS